uniref:Jumonji domain-containing protein 4 n=1 Tax=Riptortus pedestris TaxID=329032 RepID=R4WKD7_RIPPE|nr:hypothetical protein [Riptortus pedestris]
MVLLELDSLPNIENGSNSSSESFQTFQKNEISYSQFFEKYLYRNEPCVIRGITDDWPSQQLWIHHGKPNIDYLETNYGTSMVPVANCEERYFDSQAKTCMTLSEYAAYWRKYSSASSPSLYLKDWHFMKEYPEEKIYTIPKYFGSDWLNEYLVGQDELKDDYRFVYMGPNGSWTPFHSDVFSSFSWSVNICGEKKWVFFRPGDEEKLRDKFGKLPYSVGTPESAVSSGALLLTQSVGDAVFVPSGWHHQVWNVKETISINHNWINGCNIGKMWEEIVKKLLEVEAEISDCRDMDNWSEHCQLLLNSVHGIDIPHFCSFVFYIAQVRLEALEKNTFLKTTLSHYFFGRNHILFDLFSLEKLFQLMLSTNLPSLITFENVLRNLIESINKYREL